MLMFILTLCGLSQSAAQTLTGISSNKTVSLSTWSSSYGPPELATDGEYNCSYIYTCTKDEANPWLTIDLQDLHYIHKVETSLAHYEESEAVARVLEILVGNDSFIKNKNPSHRCGTGNTVNCQPPVLGSHVTIRRNTGRQTSALCVCEVLVTGTRGCPAGSYGQECGNICSEGCFDTCNPISGACSCKPGWFDLKCEVKCSPSCQGACDKTGGACAECVAGKWGSHCQYDCSVNCKDSRCSREDGICQDRPEDGVTDAPGDPRCPAGSYGPGCRSTCSEGCFDTCDPISGACSCKPGWFSPNCDNSCVGCYRDLCDSTSGVCAGSPGGGVTIAPGNRESDVITTPGDTAAREDNVTGTSNGSGDSGGIDHLLLGVILGVLLMVAVIVALGVTCLCWRRKRADKENTDDMNGIRNIENNQTFDNVGHVPAINTQPINTVQYVHVQDSPRASPRGVTSQEVAGRGVNPYANLDITVSNLPAYIHNKMKEENAFLREYETLPVGFLKPYTVGGNPEAAPKNRFKNIIAYDSTRVHLEAPDCDALASYVNANYIKGYKKAKYFIAAQGAHANTEADFVRMIMEQNVPLVVMVANVMENGKEVCKQYWPDKDVKEGLRFGEIVVKTLKEQLFPHYVIRQIRLEKGERSHVFDHIQYTSWPDHGVPQSPAAFIDFHQRAKEMVKPKQGPTLVHCSAGVGRTGTFVVIDYLLDQARDKRKVNIHGCISDMRNQRTGMVQTVEQYVFIHEALLEALHCGQTFYLASKFELMWTKGQLKDIDRQYEILEKVKVPTPNKYLTEAKSPENLEKNRVPDILPSAQFQPFLKTEVEGCNSYINAIFTHGYEKRYANLATQSPLPNTITDFWRLVYEFGCTVIIALNDTDTENCPSYWNLTTGPFMVASLSEEKGDAYTRRTLIYNYKAEERKVEHFQFTGWHPGTLPDPFILLQLYSDVRNLLLKHGTNARSVVHCHDGVSETGLYLAMCYTCDKITNEAEVDVYHAVQKLRQTQPAFITNKDQYKWLHKAAARFISMYQNYANFK